MKPLEEILKIESDIAELNIRLRYLGKEYIKQNCPFKLGDKVVVETEDGITNGIIFKIDFSSHSNIKGLAVIGISPINKKGLRAINRNSVFFDDVVSITKFMPQP